MYIVQATFCISSSCKTALPGMRERLAPSPFLSSLFCLKLAKEATSSVTAQSLATALMNLGESSHLDPKLPARSVNVSLVCGGELQLGIHFPSCIWAEMLR